MATVADLTRDLARLRQWRTVRVVEDSTTFLAWIDRRIAETTTALQNLRGTR